MVSGAAQRGLDHRLRWRGALVLTLFGLLWAVAGASGVTAVPSTVLYVAAVVLAAVVLLVAYRALAKAPERRRRLPHLWFRGVGWVNAAQLAAIVLALYLLGVADAREFIPPVIALIVGIHFLPLAKYFDQPEYRWTGGLMCAVAVIGLAAGIGDASTGMVRAVVGFGCAAVLWGTALRLTAIR